MNESIAGRLRVEIEMVAPLAMTVLIQGEMGVGKKFVARALHARSRRADRPLVVVSCAALGERAPAAFSPDDEAFAEARGATLLLDEVAQLSPLLQVALLRALQADDARRGGEDGEPGPEVRVLATTSVDLKTEVEAGRLRADLYHRLVAYQLRVPPLRERRQEIPEIAQDLIAAFAPQIGAGEATMTPELLTTLEEAPWPGNVRELRNTLERALVRARARRPEGPLVLDSSDLDLAPLQIHAQLSEMEPLVLILERARRQALVDALARTGGNVREAGRLLGISRSLAYREAGRMGLLAARARPPAEPPRAAASAPAAEPLDQLGLG